MRPGGGPEGRLSKWSLSGESGWSKITMERRKSKPNLKMKTREWQSAVFGKK